MGQRCRELVGVLFQCVLNTAGLSKVLDKMNSETDILKQGLLSQASHFSASLSCSDERVMLKN